MDKLKLLELAENFEVEAQDDGVFFVRHKHYNVAAWIDGEEIEYAVTGAYNYGGVYLTIEMDGLKELIEFCDLMKL